MMRAKLDRGSSFALIIYPLFWVNSVFGTKSLCSSMLQRQNSSGCNFGSWSRCVKRGRRQDYRTTGRRDCRTRGCGDWGGVSGSRIADVDLRIGKGSGGGRSDGRNGKNGRYGKREAWNVKRDSRSLKLWRTGACCVRGVKWVKKVKMG